VTIPAHAADSGDQSIGRIARSRVRGPSRIRQWLVFGLVAYSFLYDNATSLPDVMGHHWTTLTHLPREIRYVELLVVIGVAVTLALFRASYLAKVLLSGCVIFAAFAGISQWNSLAAVSAVDFLRLIYLYLMPVFVFIIGMELERGCRLRGVVWKTMVVWVAVNVVVSWVQFAVLQYPSGDDITGLNKDAHVNGNLMMCVVFTLFSFGLFLRRRRYFVGAALVLATFPLSSVVKTYFFSALCLAAIMILRLLITRRTASLFRLVRNGLAAAVLLAAFLAVAFGMFQEADVTGYERLAVVMDKIRAGPTQFGPIRVYVDAAELVKRNPMVLAAGLGPYLFVNPISMGSTTPRGRQMVGSTTIVNTSRGPTDEDARGTLLLGLFMELGGIAFCVLLSLYVMMLLAVIKAMRIPDPKHRAYAAGAVGSYLLLGMTAAAALFATFDTASLTIPVMLLLGMSASTRYHSRKPMRRAHTGPHEVKWSPAGKVPSLA
jgi:hypothetical protein